MRVNANRTARLLQNKTILNTRKQETQNILHLLDKQMFKKVDLEGKQKRERERKKKKEKKRLQLHTLINKMSTMTTT